jgi:hypothetical protein
LETVKLAVSVTIFSAALWQILAYSVEKLFDRALTTACWGQQTITRIAIVQPRPFCEVDFPGKQCTRSGKGVFQQNRPKAAHSILPKISDMLPNIGFIPAGVVELIQKQQKGFAYVRP